MLEKLLRHLRGTWSWLKYRKAVVFDWRFPFQRGFTSKQVVLDIKTGEFYSLHLRVDVLLASLIKIKKLTKHDHLIQIK